MVRNEEEQLKLRLRQTAELAARMDRAAVGRFVTGEERSWAMHEARQAGVEAAFDGGDEARSIQTYYEQMWRERGIDIKYLRFSLPHDGELKEPDVEIPFDEYRSYNRSKRSALDGGK